jgi:hypothetical protein
MTLVTETVGDTLPPPDPTGRQDQLDLLAADVGVEAEAELEQAGLLDRVRSGAIAIGRVPGLARDKAAALVDTALDRVFAAPLEVHDAAEAVQLLDELREERTSKESARRVAGVIAATGTVLARVARGTGMLARAAAAGAKVVPTGRAVTMGVTTVLAAVRIGTAARLGARELQILASFLVSRLRAEGLPVERAMVEQAVTQTYLNPKARVRVRQAASPSYAKLARAWTMRAFRRPSATQQHALNRKRAGAIERLDLAALSRSWAASQERGDASGSARR